ncbi:leader peptidase (prepilin peptidase)/N-methyltransferase [Thermosipho japonicus]|uniref:Leader peptidase (Prepilin peptidase)/N-methyltransferase n=1 Tax=Thermosipho japonicus TaxID=90323 RepID=A0A841GHE7_9BACT|nr:A24 family peptidase [Thermosipho japonicus]MBB6063126.1 leader peptidase (prepilin peptidase)/N-methyltransferase [Thermosipho japonicus]
MWYFLNFLLGIILGSFLNVIIYRSVEGIKIYDPPRSFCPICKHQLKWYDNVPLLSYLLLRGKCRYCGSKIPFRYFFVECIVGVLFLIHSILFNYTEAILLNIIVFAIIPAIFIDFSIMMIPDFSWILIWTVSIIDLLLRYELWYLKTLSLITIMIIFLVIKKIYKEGLGEGDIYLIAPFSFLLIPPLSIYLLLFSSISALIYAIIKKNKIIPFGPFISISGYFLYFFMLKYY